MGFEIKQELRSSWRVFAADTKGAALVEFSMVLPVALLIFFGVIGWGYHLIALDHVYDTARNTARQIAVGALETSQAGEFADTLLQGIVGEYQTDATINGQTDMVQVTIRGDSPLAVYVGHTVPLPGLSASVAMKAE